MVEVWNETVAARLAGAVEVADTPWRRLCGLLGRKGLAAGEGLIIRPCQGVHSFGMGFAIDVVYVDGEGAVLQTVTPLSPNRCGPFVATARWVLELPAGSLAATGTTPGHRLAIRPMAGDTGVG